MHIKRQGIYRVVGGLYFQLEFEVNNLILTLEDEVSRSCNVKCIAVVDVPGEAFVIIEREGDSFNEADLF